ncbi:hypothetical protein XELAEV_18014063mg [Xenopus laevis]|uniref:Uncharacterized protein n=1 Tax=Xenopus laevis TaxID=8355 RepID=A0A974DSG3_XENLA|nr:hypothetical protein XELAEV_18014063mg [Xenopus laevis]
MEKSNGKFTDRKKDRPNKSPETGPNFGRSSQQSSPKLNLTSTDVSLIDQEVAKLVNPTIEASIKSSINNAIGKLQDNLQEISESLKSHDVQIKDLQATISEVQDDSTSTLKQVEVLETKISDLQFKMNVLENRTRHNNLKFIGISESFNTDSLITLITRTIRKTLHLYDKLPNIRIECVHRLGPP